MRSSGLLDQPPRLAYDGGRHIFAHVAIFLGFDDAGHHLAGTAAIFLHRLDTGKGSKCPHDIRRWSFDPDKQA